MNTVIEMDLKLFVRIVGEKPILFQHIISKIIKLKKLYLKSDVFVVINMVQIFIMNEKAFQPSAEMGVMT